MPHDNLVSKLGNGHGTKKREQGAMVDVSRERLSGELDELITPPIQDVDDLRADREVIRRRERALEAKEAAVEASRREMETKMKRTEAMFEEAKAEWEEGSAKMKEGNARMQEAEAKMDAAKAMFAEALKVMEGANARMMQAEAAEKVFAEMKETFIDMKRIMQAKEERVISKEEEASTSAGVKRGPPKGKAKKGKKKEIERQEVQGMDKLHLAGWQDIGTSELCEPFQQTKTSNGASNKRMRLACEEPDRGKVNSEELEAQAAKSMDIRNHDQVAVDDGAIAMTSTHFESESSTPLTDINDDGHLLRGAFVKEDTDVTPMLLQEDGSEQQGNSKRPRSGIGNEKEPGSSHAVNGNKKRKSTSPTTLAHATEERQKLPFPKADYFQMEAHEGRLWARQKRTCQSYGFLTRSGYLCRQCVAKKAYDICRFNGLRAFAVDRESQRIIGFERGKFVSAPEVKFLDITDTDEQPKMPSHEDLNRPMDSRTRRQIMLTAATALRDVLAKALNHAKQENCVRRPRELQIRAMCDFCSTGLFASSYMCSKCGYEYCEECSSIINAVEEPAKEVKSSHGLFSCVRESMKLPIHSKRDLLPMTRFSTDELASELEIMNDVLERKFTEIQAKVDVDQDEIQISHDGNVKGLHEGETIPLQPLNAMMAKDLDEERFLRTWSKGDPLMVSDVCTPHRWDAETMIEKYGTDVCEITRCDEQLPSMSQAAYNKFRKEKPLDFARYNKQVKVKQFFETFGQTKSVREDILGHGVWKLKDWPPSAEFKDSFPDLYKDFNAAVPMPDYTRRDGAKNISSLFPKNANGPDLGPKMYNAWPGEHDEGKKGTTRLHMDIADAVNIMLYAAPPVEEGEASTAEPCAVWHIFRAQDADALRCFLRETIHDAGISLDDPIHTQLYYLDDHLLRQLYESKGVFPWVIRQRQHDAIFIPAGCAHQVVNLTDCIKVAVDFLSPQNIQRCFTLTQEFRALKGDTVKSTMNPHKSASHTSQSPTPGPSSNTANADPATVEAIAMSGKKSWREDVLQLKAQLWYAWRACRVLEAVDASQSIPS